MTWRDPEGGEGAVGDERWAGCGSTAPRAIVMTRLAPESVAWRDASGDWHHSERRPASREPGGTFIVAEHRGRMVSDRIKRAVLTAGFMLLALTHEATAGLEDYVKKPDSSYAWTQTGNQKTPVGTIYTLKLTSQVWQGITWTHSLIVYEPTQVTYPDATLLIHHGGR